MTVTTEDRDVINAWLAASRDLDIEVIAPFAFTARGRAHHFLALIPHFGGGQGIVVAPLPYNAVIYEDAKTADYRCSFVNVEMCRAYARAFFIETLTEWGFTGPLEQRPAWLG